MRGAAQRVGVAIALQEVAPRRRGLRLVDIELGRQFGMARLQRRMHQVAAEHGVVLAAAEGKGDMTGRVTRRQQDTDMVADRIIVARDLGAPGFDHGSTLSTNGGTAVLAFCSVQ